VVAGTVASISGNSISINTSSNTSYTIDASSAAIVKNNASSTVSSIAVGDYVVVQGAVNGTSVTASSVIDQPASSAPGNSGNAPGHLKGMGFLGSIGSFFKHLFGF
jgi:preprotein translocase subunit YajC